MPLINSPSKKAWLANLKKELAAGKPRDQALAIAYSQQRRARKAGGGLTRRLAALRRWTEAMKADPRLAPTEHYLPMAGNQPFGSFAYRDPARASAVAANLESGAVAPLLLRRQPGGGPGLLNRRSQEGTELTDPGEYRVGFKHGGRACGCQACLSRGGRSCR